MTSRLDAPEVSVVLPTFNAASYVTEAVESILRQSFEDFELIVVDDGSTDETPEILRSFRDSRLRLHSLARGGLVSALNAGIGLAAGTFVARMDGDDIASARRLEEQVALLRDSPTVGMTCSNARVIDAGGKVIGSIRASWSSQEELREGLRLKQRATPIVHPSAMIRRDVLDRVGLYRDFPRAEDRDLWLRIIDDSEIFLIDSELMDYRVHASGESRQRDSMQAISSAMAVVNYEVLLETGRDIYASSPEMFDSIRKEFAALYDQAVLPASLAFRDMRREAAARKYWRVAELSVSGLARFGPKFRPGFSRASTRRLVDVVVDKAVAELQGRSDTK